MRAILAQVDVCVHHSLTDTSVCSVLSKIALKTVASLAFCSAELENLQIPPYIIAIVRA